ncbi:hypothetical protein [Luethyella okanaganae]|uniref:O-antigen/teichoic acid export membrane protein n=1 Tax=Luethyella okanaganae TaxID=69372 RepID=A0ABW1VA16_9MICO
MTEASSEPVPAAASRVRHGPSGLAIVLISTAVAGGLGYIIQTVAGLALTPAQYKGFGVFWATLYLIVGGVSGIQQEVSRATREPEAERDKKASNPLRSFVVVFAVFVAIVIAASTPLWVGAVFPGHVVTSASAVVVGAVSYVGFATISGVLYGRKAWPILALVVVVDPALRLLFVSIALGVGGDQELLDWAIVLPIPITFLLSLLLVRFRLPHRSVVDVPLRVLVSNSAQTIVGTTATAVLVSGLPLFIGASSGGEDPSDVGSLIFNITLTRAPLVIPFLALQSYLIVHFRDQLRALWASLLKVLAIVAVATVVASVLVWLFAPVVVGWIFGSGYVLSGATLAGLVASAGLTGALCVSGPAVIARSGHTAFLVGWVLAALCLVAVLFTPWDLLSRTATALVVAPLLGLIVHLGYLLLFDLGERRASTSS